MARFLQWIWRQGILATFLAGLFAVLPLVLTLAILGWVAGYLRAFLGPNGTLGRPMMAIGLHIVNEDFVAWLIGLALVLVGVWLIGVLAQSVLRNRLAWAIDAVFNRIPVFKSLYGSIAQLVAMLKHDDQAELSSMCPVFYRFSADNSGGLLGLLASPDAHAFHARPHYLIYIPTSPLPMTGGLIFAPVDQVQKLEMSVEQVMRVYLSMGILSSQVLPRHAGED